MFKIAIRHLVKNKLHSLISIFGLAVGLSACLLISIHVFHELSYDQFHAKKDRIYRVSSRLNFNGEVDAAMSSLALGPTLKNDFPEVENFLRFRNMGTPAIQLDQQIFNNIRMAQTDSTIFQVLDIKLLKGDPDLALSGPKSIVISEQTAQKLFGDEDPMNQSLQMGALSLIVTGIMADPPMNTEFQYDAYLQLHKSTLPQWDAYIRDWFRIGFNTFIQLPENYDASLFLDKLRQFEEKYVKPWAAAASLSAGIEYNICTLDKLHFDNKKQYDNPKGNPTHLLVFSILAVFLLLIASINFINLSLAQSSKRAKEIGVRKTLGVSLWGLQRQFLTESTLVTLISLLLSLAFVEMLIPAFNLLTGKEFSLSALMQPAPILMMICLVCLIGFGAGSYPAFVLSRLEANQALRGGVGALGKIGVFRKILLFVQFAFSLFMITGTFLIADQMQYMADKDLGFDKEQVLSVDVYSMPNKYKKYKLAKEVLSKNENIIDVTTSMFVPGNGYVSGTDLRHKINDKSLNTASNVVDYNYIDFAKIKVLKGRNFSDKKSIDKTNKIIINETAAKALGIYNKPLGEKLSLGWLEDEDTENSFEVIGMVKDYHFDGFDTKIAPMFFVLWEGMSFTYSWIPAIQFKIKPNNIDRTIAEIETYWKQNIDAKYPFSFEFLDQKFAKTYKKYKKQQTFA